MNYKMPVPRWKSIIRSVIRHIILLVLMVVIVGALIGLTWYLWPGAYVDVVFPDS